MNENYFNKDLYKILEVDFTVTQEDLKKHYRRLVHKHHPDKNNGDDKKFKEINEAYKILSDKFDKESYDYYYENHYHFNDSLIRNSADKKYIDDKDDSIPNVIKVMCIVAFFVIVAISSIILKDGSVDTTEVGTLIKNTSETNTSNEVQINYTNDTFSNFSFKQKFSTVGPSISSNNFIFKNEYHPEYLESESGEYLVVELIVKNNGKMTDLVNLENPKFIDGEQREYSPVAFYNAEKVLNIFDTNRKLEDLGGFNDFISLAPGLHTKKMFIFEVPFGVKSGYFEVTAK